MSEPARLTFQECLHELNTLCWRLTKGVVQAGPFKGLKLGPKFKWLQGEIANLLLGVYEQELHPYVWCYPSFLQSRAPLSIINVGSSEGYYALGLARLYPEAIIIASDIDPDAQQITQENALLNGMANRVTIWDKMTHGDLNSFIIPGRTLIFSDCEGYEQELLDPAKVPQLAKADFIVESHSRTVTEGFPTLFAPTHKIELVEEDKNVRWPLINRLLSRDWLGAMEKGILYKRHWISGRAQS